MVSDSVKHFLFVVVSFLFLLISFHQFFSFIFSSILTFLAINSHFMVTFYHLYHSTIWCGSEAISRQFCSFWQQLLRSHHTIPSTNPLSTLFLLF